LSSSSREILERGVQLDDRATVASPGL